jgi:hypothetical protein
MRSLEVVAQLPAGEENGEENVGEEGNAALVRNRLGKELLTAQGLEIAAASQRLL